MRSVLAILVAAIAACSGKADITSDSMPASCPDGMHMLVQLDPVTRPAVDILVMVDNSGGMAEQQANLVSNFPLLIQSLLEGGDVTDMHIGVVSQDMGTGGYPIETCSDPIDGDDGVLLHTPSRAMMGCDEAYPSFLSYRREEPDSGLIEWIQIGVGCIAVLGVDGCGFEQPLKAVARALVDHAGGANSGFLRDDSLLVALFLSDEDDCSVAGGHERIFDTEDASLGHLNLRCFHHPYMVEPVETYIEAFESLRSDPEKFVLGFIVGVPLGVECEGTGDEIPACLEHPDMIERLDPVSMTWLVPSCLCSSYSAYPPRRLVQIALHFGSRALVQSICANNFRPAIEDLTTMVHERLLNEPLSTVLPVERDADNPCLCRAACTLVEEVPDMVRCPPEKPCYEPGGTGTGCAFEEDEDGNPLPLCTIPQVDTRPDDCSLTCGHPGAARVVDDGEGWAYVVSPAAGPRIVFTGGIRPWPWSRSYLSCCF